MIPTVIVHSPAAANTNTAATDTHTGCKCRDTECETQSHSTTCKQHLRSNHEQVRYYSHTMYFRYYHKISRIIITGCVWVSLSEWGIFTFILTIVHVNNIPTMQLFIGISRNTQSNCLCYHWLSVSGNSKKMNCGILMNMCPIVYNFSGLFWTVIEPETKWRLFSKWPSEFCILYYVF